MTETYESVELFVAMRRKCEGRRRPTAGEATTEE